MQYFKLLSDQGLTLNESKCKFFQKEIEYLGFILDVNGIRTNPNKIKALLEAPPAPKNLTELQSFLGGVNYYGKFIPDMATITSPLYALLRRKDSKWNWSTVQQNSFKILKEKLTQTPVLFIYDKTLPLKLDCDASSYGVGAVLSHILPDNSERPIAFASRTLNKHEKMYSQLDKEGLAVIFGLKDISPVRIRTPLHTAPIIKRYHTFLTYKHQFQP